MDEDLAAILESRLAALGVVTRRLRLAPRGAAPGHAEVERLARVIESRAEAIGRELGANGAPVACYASGLDAAAALYAAARRPTLFAALALRGVALDYVWPSLRWVRAPTLLLVAAYDQPAVDFHRMAALEIGPRASALVLPRATSALEEPGARYAAATALADWLRAQLLPAAPADAREPTTARGRHRLSIARCAAWWARRYHAALSRVGSLAAGVR